MIERDHTTATYVASSVLALGLVIASICTARGDVPAQATATQPIVVSFTSGAAQAEYPTHARTVAEFLKERNVAPAPGDYVSPALDAELSEGARVAYRPAVPVELRLGKRRLAVRSAAATVADLIAERGISLGRDDRAFPGPETPLRARSVVRIVHISHITKRLVNSVAPPVRRRLDARLALGEMRTVDPGRSGLRETIVRVERRDDGTPPRVTRASRLVRAPRPAIVAIGTAARGREFVEVARTGLDAAARLASKAMTMIATAYTAGCYGCSGITAMGLHAGHGIVAVDPRVIPLGTKLYVPGYGPALAGDIGGNIRGSRIDLGFNSLAEAIRFGRREITVYVMR